MSWILPSFLNQNTHQMSYKTIIEQVVKDKQKFINLDDNSLKEIPSELFELSNIIKVNLSNNKISGKNIVSVSSSPNPSSAS